MPDSQDLPHIGVFHLGGTISCEEDPVTKKKEPKKEKVQMMLEYDIPHDVRSRFGKIFYFEADELKDSSQYENTDLQRLVYDFRKLLRNYPGLNWIIAGGTDQASMYMHAFAMGVPRQELGNGMILGAVANRHASPNRPVDLRQEFYHEEESEPVMVLADCVRIMTSKSHRLPGKIALMTPGCLLPPLGLHKERTSGGFNIGSRFKTVGIKMGNDWKTLQNPQEHYPLIPRGDCDCYRLVQGIEADVLHSGSNYENWKAGLEKKLEIPWAIDRGLSANVLIAPGEGSLREDEKKLEHLAIGIEQSAEKGVPTMLIGDPLQPEPPENWDEDPDEKSEQASYAGRFKWVQDILARKSPTHTTRLIDGGKMSFTEANLQLAHSVADARLKHNLKGDEIVEYTQAMIARYRLAMRG